MLSQSENGTGNTKNNSESPIQMIIQEYRKDRRLSLRGFSNALVENVPNESISHQAVHYWEIGNQAPSFSLLLTLAFQTSDWRRNFALDCLAALRPESFQPAGEIGKRILQAD
jgi:hypothetical protein